MPTMVINGVTITGGLNITIRNGNVFKTEYTKRKGPDRNRDLRLQDTSAFEDGQDVRWNSIGERASEFARGDVFDPSFNVPLEWTLFDRDSSLLRSFLRKLSFRPRVFEGAAPLCDAMIESAPAFVHADSFCI